MYLLDVMYEWSYKKRLVVISIVCIIIGFILNPGYMLGASWSVIYPIIHITSFSPILLVLIPTVFGLYALLLYIFR